MDNYTQYYKNLHASGNVPVNSGKYLSEIKSRFGFEPSVIYDIGSAVLHWTKVAKPVWPNARIIAFEAVREVEEFYQSFPIEYQIGVFSDVDDKEVTFYEHPIYLGGNSYYKENSKYSKAAERIYDKEHESIRKTMTVDSVVSHRKFPLPQMVKIDVQGAEIDILNGMKNTLQSVAHIIVELQHVEYNVGAHLNTYSIPFIESLGFELVLRPGENNKYFCGNGPDADYHFIRKGLLNV